MKVCIFARVSKTEGQNIDRQLDDLTGFCKKQNWDVVQTITEKISGSKRNIERPGLQKVLSLATTGKIQKVVISEVSRLGRSVKESIDVIEKLNDQKVSIYIQNIGMETLLHDGKPNFMFKPILLTLVGFAEMERDLLRERTKSGIAAARKRNGGKWGRPEGSQDAGEVLLKYKSVVKKINDYPSASLRDLAGMAGVAPNTVRKVKNLMGVD